MLNALKKLVCFRRMANNRRSRPAASPDKIFRAEINKSLVESRFENPRKFLPEDAIRQLTTEKKIQPLLPNASQELIHFIRKKAKRVFLTAAFDHPADVNLNEFAELLQRFNFTDSNLPIDDISYNGSCEWFEERGRDCCEHDPELEVFHDWEESSVTRFFENQFQFNSPVFKKTGSAEQISENSIMPFTWVSPITKDGHFSSVREAKLRTDHQDHTKCDNKIIPVAIKQLKCLEGLDLKAAFELEAKALNNIGSLHHRHIISPISAFQRGDNYYILLEFADGGTLREKWRKDGDIYKSLSREHVKCFIRQMLGLVQAINHLHKPASRKGTELQSESRETSEQPNTTGISFTITQPDDLDALITPEGDSLASHWRHGDLKPDNILVFEDTTWLGTLKIADLGLAKQHENATSDRNAPTNTTHSTLHYEAPEVITRPKQPRSRRYDIWSMGCIIFESLIWLLYGHDRLSTFLNKPKANKSIETVYFTVADRIDGKWAKISSLVNNLIDEMITKDPECKPKATAIGDLLSLVRDRLLVIALPGSPIEPGLQLRADASEVEREIRRIWTKAQRKDGYLFTGMSRDDAAIPETLEISKNQPTKRRDSGIALRSHESQDNVICKLI
ncbi:kinase-like domain-containing protein [Mariannaea sp. PMI_226]|nr:kinase-like domain-containing protein [Mariannaea sp. PMI_226]